MFLDEISMWICGLKVPWSPQSGGASSNPLRTWVEQKSSRNLLLLLAACLLSWDTDLLPPAFGLGLHHWLLWFSGFQTQAGIRSPASLGLWLANGRSGHFSASIIVWTNSAQSISFRTYVLLFLFLWRPCLIQSCSGRSINICQTYSKNKTQLCYVIHQWDWPGP